MENKIKNLIAFLLISGFWYSVFSFIMWEPNAFAWHWGVRLLYSLVIIGTLHHSEFKED
jgi:hypothetical protein